METSRDGHNGEVPRLLEPSSEMPERAARAQRMMAALARVDIARFLVAHPMSTIGDIVKGTGLGRAAVRAGLGAIDEIGFLLKDGEGELRGHHVRYSVDRKALMTAFNELAVYTFG